MKVNMLTPNKGDTEVLAYLLSIYSGYDNSKLYSNLARKLSAAHQEYIESLKDIVDEEKDNIKETFKYNARIIGGGKEIWYSLCTHENCEYVLTQAELNKLKAENNRLNRANVKLTELWLKLLNMDFSITK